jgi:hypothetical protein
VPANAASALLVDKLGQTTSISAQDGAYRLSLPPATTNTVNGDPTLYLIGGSPLLVVEGTPRLPAPEPSAPNPPPGKKRR